MLSRSLSLEQNFECGAFGQAATLSVNPNLKGAEERDFSFDQAAEMQLSNFYDKNIALRSPIAVEAVLAANEIAFSEIFPPIYERGDPFPSV